ncbi:MAG: DsrE family protein [Eubacteriaceae bacterium]|nr:DsrE family protein [Eubacteriaceae bacterium]
MKIAIEIETHEFEKARNTFHFAVTSKKQGYEIIVFLMGEALECEELTHEKYNIDEQLHNLVNAGGEILACGTCIKSYHLEDSLEVCPI